MGFEKIELTALIGWARYWSLKAVQEMVPCSELIIQTCPITLEMTGNKTTRVISFKFKGACLGNKFAGSCQLFCGLAGWYISSITVSINEGPAKKFHEIGSFQFASVLTSA